MWQTREEIINFLARFADRHEHYTQAQNSVIIDLLLDIRALLEKQSGH